MDLSLPEVECLIRFPAETYGDALLAIFYFAILSWAIKCMRGYIALAAWIYGIASITEKISD
jgi:hypothetical protein